MSVIANANTARCSRAACLGLFHPEIGLAEPFIPANPESVN
jgi:hypothetical protein